MKTNLRRAHQIRSLIETDLVQDTGVEPLTLYVTEEAVDDKLRKYQSNLVAKQARADKLEAILGVLRQTINTANQAAGLDDLLRQLASAKRELNRLTRLVELGDDGEAEDTLLIQLRQAKFKFENTSGSETSYSQPRESVAGYPIPKQVVEDAKNRQVVVLRIIRKISDDLLSINYNTQVEVFDEDITYLESERII